MRRIAIFAAVVAVSALGFAPASASDLCYEVDINVNGTPVQQADCVEF